MPRGMTRQRVSGWKMWTLLLVAVTLAWAVATPSVCANIVDRRLSAGHREHHHHSGDDAPELAMWPVVRTPITPMPVSGDNRFHAAPNSAPSPTTAHRPYHTMRRLLRECSTTTALSPRGRRSMQVCACVLRGKTSEGVLIFEIINFYPHVMTRHCATTVNCRRSLATALSLKFARF